MTDEELKLNPKNTDVHILLAEYHARLGHAEAARMHIQQALKLHPDDPETMFFAALVENQLGDTAHAIQWLSKKISQDNSPAKSNTAMISITRANAPAFQSAVTPHAKTI